MKLERLTVSLFCVVIYQSAFAGALDTTQECLVTTCEHSCGDWKPPVFRKNNFLSRSSSTQTSGEPKPTILPNSRMPTYTESDRGSFETMYTVAKPTTVPLQTTGFHYGATSADHEGRYREERELLSEDFSTDPSRSQNQMTVQTDRDLKFDDSINNTVPYFLSPSSSANQSILNIFTNTRATQNPQRIITPNERHQKILSYIDPEVLQQLMAFAQCYCDELCPLFGDCCSDYYSICLNMDPINLRKLENLVDGSMVSSNISQLVKRMGCVEFFPWEHEYFRMVNRCDNVTREQQSADKERCEGRAWKHNITSVPVFLQSDLNIIFKNIFCAYCNGFELHDLHVLLISADCTTNLTFDSQESLSHALDNGQCFLNLADNDLPRFRACAQDNDVSSSCDHPGEQRRRKASCLKRHDSLSAPREGPQTLVKNATHRRFNESFLYKFQSSESSAFYRDDSIEKKSEKEMITPFNWVQPFKFPRGRFHWRLPRRNDSDDTFVPESNFTDQERLHSMLILCNAYRQIVNCGTDDNIKLFANPYCAVCSNPDCAVCLKEVERGTAITTCLPFPKVTSTTNGYPSNEGSHSFASAETVPRGSRFLVYFQLQSPSNWYYKVNGEYISPDIITCQNDEVYVPYYSLCEPLYCPPGMYPFMGSCLIEERLLADPAYQLAPNGTNNIRLQVYLNVSNGIESFPSEKLKDKLESVVETKSETHMSLLASSLRMKKPLTGAHSDNVTTDVCLNFELKLNLSLYNSVGDLFNLAKDLHVVLKDFHSTLNSVAISNVVMFSSDLQVCLNGTLEHVHQESLTSVENNSYFVKINSTFYNIENIGFRMQLFPLVNSTPVLTEALVCHRITPFNLTCHGLGYIFLKPFTFHVIDNVTLVMQDGSAYGTDLYHLSEEGTAVVCNTFNSTYRPRFRMSDFYNLESIVSVCTLLVSIVSLLVVLVVYFLLPQLRNVPGIIIMSMCISLLISQTLMLFSALPVGWLCQLYACVCHVFLLASYVWKTVLIFDLMLMMRIRSIESSSRSTRACMLRWYSWAGWGFPFLFVLCFWALDYSNVIPVVYGVSGFCFIVTDLGELFLVIVPFALSYCFSGPCFIISLRMIYKSSRFQRNAVRSCNTCKVDHQRLIVYFRLSLLMGITWVLCLAAAVIDAEWLWIAHIVINGSQGFHMLLCFIIKRRIFVMLKEKFAPLAGRPVRRRELGTAEKGISTSSTTMDLSV